ncbi:anaerobic sulfatase maturase [candidate division KSB1 bacterium]
MVTASRDFQIFAKPTGAICNLGCHYCYYLQKEHLYPEAESFRMPEDILEKYIIQHIEASPEPVIRFSWHGGEPTILGLDYFRRIVALQRRHQPSGRRIANGMQTNGILLDDDWCRFLAEEDFAVGLSIDGPQGLHDRYRVTRGGNPSHAQTMRGFELMRRHGIKFDVLCVVHAENAGHPIKVYRYFKQLEVGYVSFLPLVELQPDAENGVTDRTVPAEAFGSFLCTIYDEWIREDIGRTRIQIFEEAASAAFEQEHALCIFRKTCGDVPVIEHNGDFFSCDHFVDAEHNLGNIRNTPLVELLESPAQRAFGKVKEDTLPRYCRECEVRDMCNGGCPKNRFIRTPDGEAGLNYLCAGYKRFFTHCRPFVTELAALSRQTAAEGKATEEQTEDARPGQKTGRNDPCPCGSGRKYKHCCMAG